MMVRVVFAFGVGRPRGRLRIAQAPPRPLYNPSLAAQAAAVGNSRRIMLNHGWTEPAILWTAIVGESGTQKTPAFKLAVQAVRSRQHRLMKAHTEAMKQWEADNARYEIAFTQWKSQAANRFTLPYQSRRLRRVADYRLFDDSPARRPRTRAATSSRIDFTILSSGFPSQ